MGKSFFWEKKTKVRCSSSDPRSSSRSAPLLGGADQPIVAESRRRKASSVSATTCGCGVRPRDIHNTLRSVPTDAQHSQGPRRGDGNVPSGPWGGTAGGNIISYYFFLLKKRKPISSLLVGKSSKYNHSGVPAQISRREASTEPFFYRLDTFSSSK